MTLVSASLEADRLPASHGREPRKPTAEKADFESMLFGCVITARELNTGGRGPGHSYLVNCTLKDGRTAEAVVRLTHTFTAKDLMPDTNAKNQLETQFAVQNQGRESGQRRPVMPLSPATPTTMPIPGKSPSASESSPIKLPDRTQPFEQQAAQLHDYARESRGIDGLPSTMPSNDRSSFKNFEIAAAIVPGVGKTWGELRPEEKAVLAKNYTVFDLLKLNNHKNDAVAIAHEFYPNQSGNTKLDDNCKQNAAQHIMRAALGTASFGESSTRQLVTAHEYPQFLDGKTPTSNRASAIKESTMDLANNEVGFLIGIKAKQMFPNDEGKQKEAIISMTINAVESGLFDGHAIAVKEANRPNGNPGNVLARTAPAMPIA